MHCKNQCTAKKKKYKILQKFTLNFLIKPKHITYTYIYIYIYMYIG